jgi:membrane protein DedA with SNARE-associated domain
MDSLFATFAENRIVLCALLFLGPFVLEEAAILGGSAIAASAALPSFVVFAILLAGIVVSDWLLYAIGAMAARSPRVSRWVGDANLRRGRALLDRGVVPASTLARLVPWLLLPVFVASGFFRVRFARFAAVNALVAVIYLSVLFWGVYWFDVVLIERLHRWGWLAVIVLAIAIAVASVWFGRQWVRPLEDEGPDDDGKGHDQG